MVVRELSQMQERSFYKLKMNAFRLLTALAFSSFVKDTVLACQYPTPKPFIEIVPPLRWARCLHMGGFACRNAERIVDKDPNPAINTTNAPPYNPLSLACAKGEFLNPQSFFLKDINKCLDYRAKGICYRWKENDWVCIDDYSCMGLFGNRIITIGDGSTSNSNANTTDCPTYKPSSYMKCHNTTDDSFIACRPSEVGCKEDSEYSLRSNAFLKKEYCAGYVNVTNSWIRCRAVVASKRTSVYCAFEVCDDGDSWITGERFYNNVSCRSDLYKYQLCYNPLRNLSSINSTYYTLSLIPDYENSTKLCGSGKVLLTVEKPLNFSSPRDGNVTEGLYANSTDVIHYRCAANQSPICRPSNNGSSICFFNETLISNEVFYGIKDCQRRLYWSLMCYNAYSPDPTRTTCQNDIIGCGNGTIAKSYHSSISQAIADNRCLNDNSAMWSRCTSKNSTGRHICRISSKVNTTGVTNTSLFGCLAERGEVQIAPTNFDLTKNECLSFTKYVKCYNTSSTTNEIYGFTSFSCQPDSNLCIPPQRPIFSDANYVFADKKSCLAAKPTAWVRCRKNYTGEDSDHGLITCRPASLSCNADETPMDGVPSVKTVWECLNTNRPGNYAAWCRCRVGSKDPFMYSCLRYQPSSGSPCCGSYTQVPDIATFYSTQSNCFDGTFS